ncbi:hypothetical protein HDU98_011874 [Podochytrium sp. JEL0797]|nr:hypothetical protein HDU98_011874 [Podochytrium sp. JEL0797]
MRFLSVLSLAASAVHAAIGDGCTSSTGASISIIAPVAGEVLTAGSQYNIVWNQVGGDATYGAAPLSFVVGDASNPRNIVPAAGGTISGVNATISTGSVKVTVPNVAAKGNYTLEAKYVDVGASKTNLVCFSPQFSVVAGAVATTAYASVVPTVKSGAGAVGAGVLAALVGLFV